MSIEELRKKHDKGDVFSIIKNFPNQLKDARKLCANIPKKNYKNIVVTGVGGSAISGDMLKMCCNNKTKIPIIVNRDYNIPEFVDEDTLFFVSSYSGNTEETLSAFEQAKNKGATIVGVTSGGRLSEMCENTIKIPAGLPPRMSLGYLSIPMLMTLQKAGMLGTADELSKDLDEAITVLESMSRELSLDNNDTWKLALVVKNSIPIIYVSEQFRYVAYRWVTQINENAKQFAFYETIPEQNHNEINAIANNKRKDLVNIFIRDEKEHKQIKKRFNFLKNLAASNNIEVHEVFTRGNSAMARMLSAVYLGDFFSYYLALLNGVDPKNVDIIEKLKEHMKN